MDALSIMFFTVYAPVILFGLWAMADDSRRLKDR